MATKRHPNLVVFIAAVIYNRQPNWSHTMMITEILDTHLVATYEKKILGSNKLHMWLWLSISTKSIIYMKSKTV